MKDKNVIIYILAGVLGLIVVATIITTIVSTKNIQGQKSKTKEYSKHYAFITNLDDSAQMWDDAFEGAKAYGDENDICVEWFGKELVRQYSKTELLEMAIAADVDGIIIQGDDGSEMNNLVNKANAKNIPVIAMWTDCYGTYRDSFVGMSSYNLGQSYGNYIISNAKEDQDSVLVIINSGDDDSSEKIIYSGMKETLTSVSGKEYSVNTIIVDDKSNLSIEESIRNMLLNEGENYDVIVCLDENTTDILSRLLVDYNKVGISTIIGFYCSNATLGAISSGVIDASISVDGTKLGELCVNALKDFEETGFVSDYIPMEITTITSKNVEGWLDE